MAKSKNAVTVRGPWIPESVEFLRSRVCAQLSPHACKLLQDLKAQLSYNAKGNGDLTITWSVMVVRGWKSAATLQAAIKELIDAKLLVMTRQGGRHICSLYALTLWPMDCDFKKLDVSPGCYLTSDWTKGNRRDQEPPSETDCATWHRPRRGNGH